MGKPLSLDLRHRICGYVAAGIFCRAAGRIFGVSAATGVRYAADKRERRDVTPRPQGRPVGRFGQLAPYKDFLIGVIRAEPDITLHELSGALEDTSGVSVHLSSIHRALVRAGFLYEKRTYRTGT
ncbi:hypothetical protein ROLI_034960 [Roseobacter fucihabitans]|uniref:Transposase n=1 Tax=Roseobacter fucihabitans TaxID=1537242 RepID=A0ABZ2BWI2_9RHOB